METQQASTANYILQQYIAGAGGQTPLMSVQSMHAVGKVRTSTSEFHMGNDDSAAAPPPTTKNGEGAIGGFVLWQKNPELWFFELIMAGYKLSAGCNGRIAWRQSTVEPPHASRGPPRALRRTLYTNFSMEVINVLSGTASMTESFFSRSNDAQY